VIDRVDVAADGRRAIVRDYKSGSSRQEHAGARWAVERQLQVALYMLAVRELLGLEPVAGVYQPLGGGDLRARGLFLEGAGAGSCLVATDGRDREALDAALDDAVARALALAVRLRAGELVPCPETCSRDGCKYPGICRSS
jgi:RecB family exonuclease